mmetsp:Transcript_101435/g.316244  ORF Transcript_101435/g.316244 Transcript_101435/m.316244 type:complete len:216 (-) Transcript_101435:690-1337(-)
MPALPVHVAERRVRQAHECVGRGVGGGRRQEEDEREAQGQPHHLGTGVYRGHGLLRVPVRGVRPGREGGRRRGLAQDALGEVRSAGEARARGHHRLVALEAARGDDGPTLDAGQGRLHGPGGSYVDEGGQQVVRHLLGERPVDALHHARGHIRPVHFDAEVHVDPPADGEVVLAHTSGQREGHGRAVHGPVQHHRGEHEPLQALDAPHVAPQLHA